MSFTIFIIIAFDWVIIIVRWSQGGSRGAIWMILLRVFFNFGVEVLEGFEA